MNKTKEYLESYFINAYNKEYTISYVFFDGYTAIITQINYN